VYWGPKLWGRRLPDGASLLLALLGTFAVVLIGLPMAIAGFLDQPAGQVAFQEEDASAILNALTGAGYALLAVVVLALGLLAVRGFHKGAEAGDDPWDGQTLEWATTSPPPIQNFEFDQSPVASGEPLFDRKEVW
jgi:heme/copper-type cytochrome/quinol oxidase subunit 1